MKHPYAPGVFALFLILVGAAWLACLCTAPTVHTTVPTDDPTPVPVPTPEPEDNTPEWVKDLDRYGGAIHYDAHNQFNYEKWIVYKEDHVEYSEYPYSSPDYYSPALIIYGAFSGTCPYGDILRVYVTGIGLVYERPW